MVLSQLFPLSLAVYAVRTMWWRVESGEWRVERAMTWEKIPSCFTEVRSSSSKLVLSRTNGVISKNIEEHESLELLSLLLIIFI